MAILHAAPPPDSRALIALLEGRLGPSDRNIGDSLFRFALDGDSSISLHLDGDGDWSLRLRQGRLGFIPGLAPNASTRILGDPATLAAVIKGTRSGIEAFLAGEIRVRGNIPLAMQLEEIFASRARPRRFPRPARVDAGGLDTFYLDAGSGPVVILLHGLGASNASMLSTLWELSRDHRVLAPDMPGFGDSDKPIRSYDAAFFAEWLGDFMDAVGVDRADIIGNSLGGRVALEAGLAMPERVERLVMLCGSAAFIHGRQYVPLVRLLRPELGVVPLLLTHGEVVALARAMFSRPDRLPGGWYDAFADEFLRVFASPRGRIAFFSAARQVYLEEPRGRRGFWDRLPGLKPPALFIWGERDRLVPAGFARHVEAAVPKARSIVLPDCGHVPQYEKPEETHRAVRRFLRERELN
jgi:pimeloyl-ACP methyl ester carboxylesterase